MARKYSMHRRSAAVEETRQRIIEATAQLHDEKGILATTMQDVAARADVALGTVYRHFPSMNELVPACGALKFSLSPLPVAADFEHLDGAERLGAVVRALFRHYKELHRPYEVGYCEAPHLPILQSFMTGASAQIRELIDFAVDGLKPEPGTCRLAQALCGFHAWQSFNEAGFSPEEAAGQVVAVLLRRPVPEGGEMVNA